MPTVNVIIGNSQYELACDNGEEQHIRNLARQVSLRFKELEKMFEHASDTKLLAMTCLFMEDEIRQLKDKNSPTVAQAVEVNASAVEDARRKTLESLAEQLEALANKVESL